MSDVTGLCGLPKTSYLVCGNQRSGTTLLCSALADTGVAGRPDEYFLAVNEAEQPGWRCWEEGPFDLIRALEGLIVEGEQGWRELYREIGVIPIEVVYEELANPEAYERSVRDVLEQLGLDSRFAQIPPPRTRRQADDVNEAWVSRYLSERRVPREV